jgi:hypothetical protein
MRETPRIALWRRALRQFADPLVLLLLVAIAISTAAWIADGVERVPAEPLVIAAIVVLNAAIGTWQEERAVEAVPPSGASPHPGRRAAGWSRSRSTRRSDARHGRGAVTFGPTCRRQVT